MRAQEFIVEAFDQPYDMSWEKGEAGEDYDALVRLPDGSNLSIMFNEEGPDQYMVEFWRGAEQSVTGEGDAQRIFATVLAAIAKFIQQHQPQSIVFSAHKEDDPEQKSDSRSKLYNRLVQRYAGTMGYSYRSWDTGDSVQYELTRLKPGVAEGLENNRISFQVQKAKNKFATTLSIGNNPVGVYQYDADTGRSIAEVYPEFKGKGLGKLLVLHAIYTAAQLGLNFQEDESRTAEYDNVLDSLSSNGYIVDDDGYWYVTGEGEQYLQQSMKQDVAEAFDKPYAFNWDSSYYGNYGINVKLPDGNSLTISFYNEDKDNDVWHVAFARGYSQEVTGEGDAQRIFATVLHAIQQFIGKVHPEKLYFSASKKVEPGQNSESRAKLYSRMVKRYASSMGYDSVTDDFGRDSVMYILNKKQGVTEGESRGGIDLEVTELPDEDQILITATSHGKTLGRVYFDIFDSQLVAADAEVASEYRGQGIAAIIYDYAKELGWEVVRSGRQTDAGAGFWDKHRPKQDVWEDADNMNFEQGDCPIFAIALHRLSKLPLMALVEYDDEMGSAVLVHAYVKLNDKWRIDATGETDVDWMLQKYPNNGSAEEIEISERDLIKLGYGKNKCPTLQQVVPHAKEVLQDIELNENFADGKVKGKSRPGRVRRAGASCNGSVTDLRQRAKNASGERAKMYHWCANMKSGRNKS